MKGLPQQQQLVLCALVLLLGKHGGAAAEAPGGFPATPVKTPLKLAQVRPAAAPQLLVASCSLPGGRADQILLRVKHWGMCLRGRIIM